MSIKIETIKLDPIAATAGANVALKDFQVSEEVRALLEKNGVNLYPANSTIGDKAISWAGRAYTLPAEPRQVTLEEAAEALKQKAAEENEIISVFEMVDAMPWDGAQAFQKAIEFLFGWGISKPTPGFFGPKPPVLRSISTGPNPGDTIQVFWGHVEIPQLGCTLKTAVAVKDNARIVFSIGGQIPKGKRHLLDALVSLTRIFARERSIYKGKAIRMFVEDNGDLNFEHEPEFISTDIATVDQLIFSEGTRRQIETNLFTPIRHSNVCRQMGIPLKRGVLLEGPYGTGKSLTARATAALAQQNGWTFIMINRVAGLKSVLDFAHRYAPVVVFAEDIDRVVEGQGRSVSIDDILNTLDGVQSKDHDIMTVLTSNHADKINRAMMRPGRLDAIISIDAPDAEAAERLIRQYGAGLIDENEDLTEAKRVLAGRIPAVIRETVERAKLATITRANGAVPSDLKSDDIVVAAETMQVQLGLLYGSPEAEKSVAEQLGVALIDSVRESIHGSSLIDRLNDIKTKLDEGY